jgi:flagellar protein FliS
MPESNQQYMLYQRANENASQIGQLIMLYDGAIAFLRQAIEGIQEKNWEKRWNMVNKACAIITGLRECLDFEQGKETALALSNFYESLDLQLIFVHHHNKIDVCEHVIAQLQKMRETWKDVQKQVESAEGNADNANAVSNTTPIPLMEESSASGYTEIVA